MNTQQKRDRVYQACIVEMMAVAMMDEHPEEKVVKFKEILRRTEMKLERIAAQREMTQ